VGARRLRLSRLRRFRRRLSPHFRGVGATRRPSWEPRLRNLCDSSAIATGRHHPTAQVWGRSLGVSPTLSWGSSQDRSGASQRRRSPQRTAARRVPHRAHRNLKLSESCAPTCSGGWKNATIVVTPSDVRFRTDSWGIWAHVQTSADPHETHRTVRFIEPHSFMGTPRVCAARWIGRLPTHFGRTPSVYGNPTRTWGRDRRFPTILEVSARQSGFLGFRLPAGHCFRTSSGTRA